MFHDNHRFKFNVYQIDKLYDHNRYAFFFGFLVTTDNDLSLENNFLGCGLVSRVIKDW